MCSVNASPSLPLPFPLQLLTVLVLCCVVLCCGAGGTDGKAPIASVEMFDPQTNKCTPSLSPLPHTTTTTAMLLCAASPNL
jgi:hypothetical protein